MSFKRKGLWLALSLVVACASAPRPRVLSDLDAASKSAAVREAERLSPQAYAHAEQLRAQAHRAHDDGDLARTQALSEHALAAYEHAVVLSRLVRAEQEVLDAQNRLQNATAELAELDAQQRELVAEADNLEIRIKVVRDALPLVPSAPATPERETARRQAARALLSQARLLCTAARMLDPKSDRVSTELAKITDLERKPSDSGATAVDSARKLRTECLAVLAKTRRAEMQKAPAAGVSDALLKELSDAGGLMPFRDDRGVVVTVRGLFGAGTQLTPQAHQTLSFVGRVAKAHPSFPVMVVLHTAKGQTDGLSQERAKAVAAALEKAGAANVTPEAVGSAQPVVDPRRGGAAERNERVEIVFVAPAP